MKAQTEILRKQIIILNRDIARLQQLLENRISDETRLLWQYISVLTTEINILREKNNSLPLNVTVLKDFAKKQRPINEFT